MGHHFHALIGPRGPIGEFAANWHHANLFELPQQFALIPFTAALHDDIVELAAHNKPCHVQGFERLSAALEMVILSNRRFQPIAYVETDFFGGLGFQRAIAWNENRIIAGPFQSETKWTSDGKVTVPPGESPVSKVLAALGAWTKAGRDCFEMLELHRFRDTDDFAEQDS